MHISFYFSKLQPRMLGWSPLRPNRHGGAVTEPSSLCTSIHSSVAPRLSTEIHYMVLLDPRLGCRDIKSAIPVNQTGPSQAAERRVSSCIPLDSNSNQNASDRQSILGTPCPTCSSLLGPWPPFPRDILGILGGFTDVSTADRVPTNCKLPWSHDDLPHRSISDGVGRVAWHLAVTQGGSHIIHQTSQQEWRESSIVQCR